MIRINLLPQEYRGRERLSMKVWGTLLGTVVIVSCAIGYFGHVYLSEYKKIEGERVGRQDRLTNLEPQAKYDEELVAEKQEYLKRAQTIQGIANSRVMWTKLLDLFIDITNNENNDERHHTWFSNLNISGGGTKVGPVWTLNAFSQSGSFTKMANFLDDVENHREFFHDFMKISPPSGRRQTQPDKHPPEAVNFKLELRMHPPEKWAQNQQLKRR